YLPSDLAGFVGPGGLEVQLDIVAIARHARPVGATPAIPDGAKIAAAFAFVGRGDIDPAAFPVGEQALDVERTAESIWAPLHIERRGGALAWGSRHILAPVSARGDAR